jgi:hypothetical protein
MDMVGKAEVLFFSLLWATFLYQGPYQLMERVVLMHTLFLMVVLELEGVSILLLGA